MRDSDPRFTKTFDNSSTTPDSYFHGIEAVLALWNELMGSGTCYCSRDMLLAISAVRG